MTGWFKPPQDASQENSNKYTLVHAFAGVYVDGLASLGNNGGWVHAMYPTPPRDSGVTWTKTPVSARDPRVSLVCPTCRGRSNNSVLLFALCTRS